MYKLHSDRDLTFVKESADELHEFDVKSYKYASNLIFECVPASLAEMPIITDGADGVAIIENAIADLNKVSAENTETLVSFFSAVNPSTFLEKSNIVITIPNLGEIDKIRPQFLVAEAKGINEYIIKFLKGDIPAKELMYQVDKLTIANSKKNISKTILDTTKDLTTLARQVDGENVYVDGNFIRTRMIPFLSTYPATQANLIKEAGAVVAAIKDSTIMMTQSIAAVNSAIAKLDKVKALKISQYMYKITRKYIELRSYTAFIMTRKILNYTHTISQFYNLYTAISERFPEGSRVLHENVLDGELNIDVEDYDLVRDMQSGNGSLVDTKIESILNRRSSDIATATRQINGTDALNQIGISYCDYDKEIYEAVKSIFTSFNSRITDFKNAIMNGEIFDDAQSHTGFDGNLTLKYNSTIANFSNVDEKDFGHDRAPSTVPIDLAINAFGELKNMSRNIADIRSEMQAANATLQDIKNDFETSKTSQTEISVETLDEAIGFIATLETQFQQLVADVTKAAFQRAVSLDNMIERFLTAQSIPDGMVTLAESFNGLPEIPDSDGVRELMESMSQSIETLEMAKEYFAMRNLHNEGLETIYEAETTTAGTSTTTTPGSNNGTGSASSGSDKKSGGWFAQLKQFFKKLFDTLVGQANKTTEETQAFFNAFEKDIMALPENEIIEINNAIDVFKVNPANITTAVNNVCTKINSLNFKQFDNTTVTAAIFPEQVLPKNDKERLSEKTEKFYTNLGDGVSKVTIPANVISSNRKAMIDFCKNYSSTLESMRGQLENTMNVIANKAKGDGLEVMMVGMESAYVVLDGEYITEKKKTQNAQANQTTQATSTTTKDPKSASTAISAGQSEADKQNAANANNANNPDKEDEKAKLTKTYNKACDDLQNFMAGISKALKTRMGIYFNILRAVEQHVLKNDRPDVIDNMVARFAESSGMKLYGSRKVSDNQWDCWFFEENSFKFVKKSFKLG